MSKKHQHSESGRTRSERRAHDRRARAHEADVYAGESSSKRLVLVGAAIVVMAAITVLFVAGVIRW
jgi:hypothetical protein